MPSPAWHSSRRRNGFALRRSLHERRRERKKKKREKKTKTKKKKKKKTKKKSEEEKKRRKPQTIRVGFELRKNVLGKKREEQTYFLVS